MPYFPDGSLKMLIPSGKMPVSPDGIINCYSAEIEGTSSQLQGAFSELIGIARTVMSAAARKTTHAAITHTYAHGLMMSANVSAS